MGAAGLTSERFKELKDFYEKKKEENITGVELFNQMTNYVQQLERAAGSINPPTSPQFQQPSTILHEHELPKSPRDANILESPPKLGFGFDDLHAGAQKVDLSG